MKKNKLRQKFIFIIAFMIITGLLLYGSLVLHGRGYYIVSLAIVVTALLAAFISFENKELQTGYITGIVVFTVIAVGSRFIFAPFPQIKPIAAIVIIAGIAMGSQAGFMTGALSMFISNFYFLQGAWTPFQMVGMGLVGFFAGVFFYGEGESEKNKYLKTILIAVYGFLSVIILYGLVVDINTVFFSLGDEPVAEGVITVYLLGLPFDIIFAVTTAVILVFLEPVVLRKWKRIQSRYDIDV